MQQTQTINLNVVNAANTPNIPTTPGVPNTALTDLTHWLNTNYLSLILIATIAILTILAVIFFLKHRKSSKQTYRVLTKACLALAIVPSLGLLVQAATNLVANATSTLQLTSPTLDITIYRDDSNTTNPDSTNPNPTDTSPTDPLTKTLTTTTTVITDNQTGYTMSAKLNQALANNITATLNDQTLTTNPVNVYSDDTGTSPSANDNTITISIPRDIQVGKYSLGIVYGITENALPQPPQPQVACVSGSQFKGGIGDIRNASTTTATWTIGDTGIATDSRNGQEYCIGKLADNNIWMLNNLKIGSTTSTMPLTDQDTNLTTKTSFTLPQLYNGTSGHSSYTVPYTFGPVTDDVTYNHEDYDTNDITSDHFGGYLYNWTAAIAEDDSSSMTNQGDVAPNSICPKGWRLPTGGSTGEFAWLNAKMDNPAASSPSTSSSLFANWLPAGSFRGVFSGDWRSGSGFLNQGVYGSFWSSSVVSSYYYAFLLYFDDGGVYPNDYTFRNYGLGVRCVFGS
jgi:uncharacterized protein (TIGR02145 family)